MHTPSEDDALLPEDHVNFHSSHVSLRPLLYRDRNSYVTLWRSEEQTREGPALLAFSKPPQTQPRAAGPPSPHG